MSTLDDFMPDVVKTYECCKGTNIPHSEHWRYCEHCGKESFHSFQKWKPYWDSGRTSCSSCGQPNDWLVLKHG